MRNRGLARKAATAGAPASRQTLAVGNSEDNGNAVTEDKVKGKGKGKGRKEGDSKAPAQDGSNGLDAQEEKGATSSAGYRRGRRGHQRTTRSAASAVETKIEDMDVSAESPPLDLTRYSYNGQPIVKMRIADLRDALRALGCGQDGKRLELLDRLANRLLKDSTGGNSGPVPADETSERGARYQKRRTRKTFTPLRKGHDTKECPITIASDDEADADGRSEGGVSLAAGPKPGMTRAELLEAVKSLGLKPRGARKVDLEACWHEAVKSRAKEKSSEGDEGQDARQGKGHGDWGGKKEDKEAQPSVAGVPIMTMTVVALRKHVRGMGLKPSGHLKADLQRCLWDHLLEAKQAKPADAPSVEIREGRADPVKAIALSPNCVLFRGIPVADMEPDTMRGMMKDLDVPVSRKHMKEARHDLVEALVLRRAEALETRPTKQRWRGRLVYKMRKIEVTNALHHFGADESGKVEAMRSRFRQLLRDWAARDIVITESGGGMGGETVAVNKEKDSVNPDSPALNRRKTNMIASTRNECRNDFEADGTEADAGVSDATDGKPSHLPSSEVIAVSDASPVVVDSAECPELRDSDKGESGRAPMDVDDTDGVNVDARSGSQGNRAPVEVATQPTDGSQWPDCPASEEELEGDTVEEVYTEGETCEGRTENFDDESQHLDDGDIEEAPAHEYKDKVEFEAGQEAGPTQTPQVLGMARSKGEGEKEDREGHLALAGAPGSACTASKTDDPLTTADCWKDLRAEREAESVMAQDSALCSELGSSGGGEAVGGVMEGDGVAMEVNNANETGRVSQTGKPENPTLTAQPEDGSQLADCLAGGEEAECDIDTVEEVETEGEGCEGGSENFDDTDTVEEKEEEVDFEGMKGQEGTGAIEVHDAYKEAVEAEGMEAASAVVLLSQTVQLEDRPPELAAQPQHESQGMDCSSEGGEAEVDTDTVGEVDADEEAGEKIEWRGVDEEEVNIKSTKDSSGVECVSQTVNPEDRSPEPAAQRQDGSQLTDCLADEAECDTDTVEKMDVDGEAREEDEEVVESHVVDGQGQEVEAEGMEDTSGAECVWAGEEGREAEEGEDKEQDIDEDEDGYDNERALEGHVDEEEAESWEDEEGGDEKILDYGDEGVDEGASEYEDEEGEGTDEGEGEEEGEGMAMAMAMTGDTEEAAIDLAESDEEANNSAPMKDDETIKNSSSDDHDHDCTKSTVKTKKPRDNKAEFRAVFGELGDDDKTAALDFLSNPAVRPVDPSLPMLTAEEERRLASATFSASDWEDKLILALNPFLHQARHLLGRRDVSNCYAGRASDSRWPSGHDTVPAMRSRDLSPTVASRPSMGPKGSIAPAFSPRRSVGSGIGGRPARTLQANSPSVLRYRLKNLAFRRRSRSSLCHSFGSADEGLGSKPGAGDSGRPPVPGFAPNATRVPSYSMGPKGSIAPAFSPRRNVGSGIGGRPARTLQANSPSVLRYRLKNLASRRRSRSSLCPSFGSADEGLGSKPGADDSGRVAKGDHVQNEMRQQGQQPSTNNSSVHFHGSAGMENSRKRYQASMSESEGAGTMTSRRRNMDGSEEMALRARVAAVSKATTEVGNILVSVVSEGGGGGNAIDLRRQAREEAAVRDPRASHQPEAGQNEHLNTQNVGLEFAFSITHTSARRRPHMFSFANIVPAKRSRPARGRKYDGADDVGNVDAESSGVFEFPAPGRRVRQRVGIDTSATSSIVAPSMTPLEMEGSSASHGSYAVPSPAPAVKGFDMSLFRKPGEWKCEACLVKNPPGGDKCLSCETPKPGAGGGGAAVAAGSGELGVTNSTLGGALFARGAVSTTTTTKFTFGAQPSRLESGGSASSAALGHSSAAPTFAFDSQQQQQQVERSSTPHGSYAVPSPAPVVKGFDMSLFRKPGEWKCEACLVKNPPGGNKCLSCETPKLGAEGGGAAMVAGGSGEQGVTASTVAGALFAGGALSTTTTTKVSFGAQPARDTEPGDSASSAALGHSLSSSAAPTFAFGSQQYSASDGSNAASAALRLHNAASLKFGVQDGGIATGGITSKADVQNTRATTAPAASIPTNGFDMSKFVKPGEWKCEACCVRNPPSAAKCLSCETPKSGGALAWSTGKSAIGGRAGNPSAPAPGAFLFSAPSASGLNQNPGAPLFQSPGPATGGFIFGAGGESVGNSAGFGGPSARSNFGRPPVPCPSRNPSGLFGATSPFAEKPVGTAKNSTQSGFGAASWSAPGGGSNNPPVAPQPQGFMFGSGPPPARVNSPPLNPAAAPQPPGFVFGSGPSPAGANSPPPSTKYNSPRSSAF